MIPPAFVQDLLSRVDIVEIVGRSVDAEGAGINFKGLCPFHGEKSPSFTVSPDAQTYHCFGCGVHGNAIGFLMEQHGMGFIDAVQDLAPAGRHARCPRTTRSPEERERGGAQKQKQRDASTTSLAKAADALPQAAEGQRRAPSTT